MTATTALTAQNTMGVEDIQVTPPDFVRKQINACINDIGVDVVKTGMFFLSPASQYFDWQFVPRYLILT